jgi:hypothetical protein
MTRCGGTEQLGTGVHFPCSGSGGRQPWKKKLKCGAAAGQAMNARAVARFLRGWTNSAGLLASAEMKTTNIDRGTWLKKK